MRKQIVRKSDYVLLIGTIAIALILFIIQLMLPASYGRLIVQVNGEETASYFLSGEDEEFTINNGTNTVTIVDGKVRMTASNCPDQICVHHKEISKNNETIVCLPNKIVLLIKSTKEAEIDASTN